MMKLLLLFVIIASSSSEIVRQWRQTQNCAFSNCNQINGPNVLGSFIPGFPFRFGRKKREIAYEVNVVLPRVKRQSTCRSCCQDLYEYIFGCCSPCARRQEKKKHIVMIIFVKFQLFFTYITLSNNQYRASQNPINVTSIF